MTVVGLHRCLLSGNRLLFLAEETHLVIFDFQMSIVLVESAMEESRLRIYTVVVLLV